MAAIEEKKCYTCSDEDTDKEEWPCSECDRRWFSNWNPKQVSDGVDLLEM